MRVSCCVAGRAATSTGAMDQSVTAQQEQREGEGHGAAAAGCEDPEVRICEATRAKADAAEAAGVPAHATARAPAR